MFQIPKLAYEYAALEPFVDAKTMEIHHSKHHQAYCDNANKLLEDTEWVGTEPCEILTNLDHLPADKKQGILNNVGGVCNHNFFWLIMGPNQAGAPQGTLSDAIDRSFGSFANFQDQFTAAGLGQFGSGWAWLVLDAQNNLEIISTANQNSPLSLGYKRIIGLDVWEHAYYLNYQNRRPDYIKAWWNTVNWQQAETWFAQGGV